jgi:hypothetical protein
MQNEIHQSKTASSNFVKGNFESEFQAFCIRMIGKVLVVLAPFLAFSFAYNSSKVHNMLALMLDSRFKFLDVVKTHVGQAKVIHMVAKHDSKVLMPLLLVVFLFQNLGIETPFELAIVDDDDSIFGVMTFNENTIHGLLKNELIFIPPPTSKA